jgi:hypothetical protein
VSWPRESPRKHSTARITTLTSSRIVPCRTPASHST